MWLAQHVDCRFLATRLKPEGEWADVVGEHEVGSADTNPRQSTCGQRTESGSDKVEP
jgi:hypothetical protein